MMDPTDQGRREHGLPENFPHMTIEYDHVERVTVDTLGEETIKLVGEGGGWITGKATPVEP